MKKLSNILMVIFLIPLVLYIFLHGMTFMEPVNRIIEGVKESTLVLITITAVFLIVLPRIILIMTKGFREISDSVRSITKNGIKGWATVEKLYTTERKLGGNTLYFLELNIMDDQQNNYGLTVLHPIRRKDLGYFIPGTKAPIVTSSMDRTVVIFPQLDYRRLPGFCFLNKNCNGWKLALKSKREITLTQVGVTE